MPWATPPRCSVAAMGVNCVPRELKSSGFAFAYSASVLLDSSNVGDLGCNTVLRGYDSDSKNVGY